MTVQVLFFNVFSKKDLHLNAAELILSFGLVVFVESSSY